MDTPILKKARELAYRYLALRDRSERELRDYLGLKEIPDDAIEEVIRKFIAAGYIDDRRFAMSYARVLIERKGLSRYALRMELQRKGVRQDYIDGALDGLFGEDGYDEDGLALGIAQKKAAAMRNMPPDKAKRRLTAFLARRGFSFDTIKKALKTLI